jgi:uncharacterized protein YecT (DUF1311 family)
MHHRLVGLAALVLAAAMWISGISSVAAQPSFDCRTSREPVEQAICTSKPLSKLDRDIALAYKSAMARLDPQARQILREHQRRFLAARDGAFGLEYFDLPEYLAQRVKELDAIEGTNRVGYLGRWVVPSGGVSISTDTGEGGLKIAVNVADGTLGRWVCDFAGTAAPDGDALLVTAPPDAYEGWSLRLERTGAALKVTSQPPPGQTSADPPFCGKRGSLDMVYLPATKWP